MCEFYEDDGIEIDDAALLANMTTSISERLLGRSSATVAARATGASTSTATNAPGGSGSAADIMDFDVDGDDDDGVTVTGNEDQSEFLEDFRTEVAEVGNK